MDQAGKEKEALQLLAEADRKVRGSQSFFAGLFGEPGALCPPDPLFLPPPAAGNAFCQAAQLHLQLQSKHDAATNFVDAGNAFKKADPQEAINCLIRAIEIYTDMGRFTIAAKHHISIAEIYESELVDIEKVRGGLPPQPGQALQVTSTWCSPLQLAVQKYEEMFPAFTDSRECKLVKKLLDAHEEQNVDAYTDAVKEYDSISRLDQWLTTMLLRIKKTIQGEEEDLR
uniref:NSF attachment protein alpha n=1 Tax=Pavo cristatus TaxID=9049 RepID=A0A8C9FNU1_PAVCR